MYASSSLHGLFVDSPFFHSLANKGACPDGYTCLCRPCEPLPEVEFSLRLNLEGEPIGTGECEQMATCASGILAVSNLTVLVVDNWGPAREVLQSLKDVSCEKKDYQAVGKLNHIQSTVLPKVLFGNNYGRQKDAG